MERNIRNYTTLRETIGASVFVISGLLALYATYSRTDIFEKVIDVVCLLVVTPAACLWINRKSASSSQRSSAIRFIASSLLLVLLLMASPQALPQQEQRVIRVGVPVMKNSASRSVSGELERDRLVKALNDEKPDKKLHMKVEGVPLDATEPRDVASQADEKKCEYIVYTTLLQLRARDDPAEHRPGTMDINPNSQRGTQGPENAAMNPEFEATVEYKLYQTGDRRAFSSGPFSAHDALADTELVGQVMDRIANRVFDEVKKRPAPHAEKKDQ
jgi:hypothetical protein